MEISFDSFTTELAELLLEYLSTSELDFVGIRFNNHNDIKHIDVVVLHYILGKTRIGLHIESLLYSYVDLCYSVYPEVFSLVGLSSFDDVMWEAKMEMLSHNGLKEYIAFQSNLIKHNVNERDLK